MAKKSKSPGDSLLDTAKKIVAGFAGNSSQDSRPPVRDSRGVIKGANGLRGTTFEDKGDRSGQRPAAKTNPGPYSPGGMFGPRTTSPKPKPKPKPKAKAPAINSPYGPKTSGPEKAPPAGPQAGPPAPTAQDKARAARRAKRKADAAALQKKKEDARESRKGKYGKSTGTRRVGPGDIGNKGDTAKNRPRGGSR
jgi:hypothetical protein